LELDLDSLAKALVSEGAGFRAFANALPNLVWVASRDGAISFYNERFLTYTGFSEAEALERGFSALVHPNDVALLTERWRDSLAIGRPFESEFRLRHADDGSYRWFLARAEAARDESGEIAYWIGSATDIDSERRARENLDFVLESSTVFASARSIEEVCTHFADLAVRRFADWCFLVLGDKPQDYRVAAVAHRDSERVRYIEQYLDKYPVSDSSALASMLSGDGPVVFPLITDEMLQAGARDAAHLALMREMALYSAIVAPLSNGSEALGGIIMYSSESRRQFSSADGDVLKMLAERAATRISSMRALQEEQRQRRRLQFLGRATEAVYESFDLTNAFGNLARIIVSEIADMAAVFRLEADDAARVVAAAHQDELADDAVRSFVGIRVMHGEAEKRFCKSLRVRKPLVGTGFAPRSLSRTVWPYLSEEIASLSLQSMVTIPLHSRGRVYGALVAYYTDGGREFKAEDLDLLVEIGRHASIAMENADVFERERRMSETLQDSLLPPSLPKVEGLAFDAVYLPGAAEAQVGGDWYDAFRMEDGTIVVSAGDVTGRGADAAVIMGKVRHLLAIAPSYERDPARILDTVEAVLARRYPETIVTAFLGFIEPSHKRIVYANAGHPPPLLRRAHGLEELHAYGLPIGLRREGAPARAQFADLSDARMLVLYTDGLTEARHDVLAGSRTLREIVMREALLHTHHPARFIEEACLGSAASDDVAVLTISFEAGIRWSFDAENAKAAQDARGEFVAYLREYAAEAGEVEAAELVFGELVGNVVRHAPGAIDIDVEWTNGSPKLHVLDRGPAFRAPSHLPDDLLSESGRGLFIVRQLSKNVTVEHVPGYGNHVAVELPLHRKP